MDAKGANILCRKLGSMATDRHGPWAMVLGVRSGEVRIGGPVNCGRDGSDPRCWLGKGIGPRVCGSEAAGIGSGGVPRAAIAAGMGPAVSRGGKEVIFQAWELAAAEHPGWLGGTPEGSLGIIGCSNMGRPRGLLGSFQGSSSGICAGWCVGGWHGMGVADACVDGRGPAQELCGIAWLGASSQAWLYQS